MLNEGTPQRRVRFAVARVGGKPRFRLRRRSSPPGPQPAPATGPSSVGVGPRGRIVLVSPSGSLSGAESVLLRLAREVRAHGWEVATVTPPGPLAAALEAAGLEHAPIPDLKLPAGPKAVGCLVVGLRSLRAARVLRRRARRADIVLVNGLFALPAARLARLRTPVVWLVHDVIARRDWLVLLRLVSSRINAAIAPSEAAAEPLRGVGVPVRVIRNGTAWPVPERQELAEGRPVIGAMAALTPLKGQDVLLEAVARMRHRDVTVELAGEGFAKDAPYVERLRRRADLADLRGRVRFLGRVEDPVGVMRRWRVGVLASVYPEAAPLVVLEALSVGLPMVVTDQGGAKEVVGGAGLVVPGSDPEALAAELDRLLDDPGLRRRLAAAGPPLIERGLTVDAQHERLLEAFDELGERARRPAGDSTVFVVPDYKPALGGTTRQVSNQAAALCRRGHPVRVLARRRSTRWARRERDGDIDVERFGWPLPGPVGDKAAVASLVVHLLRRRAEVRQLCVVMYPDFLFAAAAGALLGRTLMIWAGLGDATDTLRPRPGLMRRIQVGARRRVCGAVTHIALTEAIEHELRSLGLDSQRIPVGVDLSQFRPGTDTVRCEQRRLLGVGDDRFVIVYTGHLRRLKAVDRLIGATERLVDAGVPVVTFIVGSGTDAPDSCAEELFTIAAPLVGSGHVRFTGSVADVRPMLWASDVFVLPSTREGMSNSLVEAMACGVPCVAPRSAGGDILLPDAGIVPPDNSAGRLAEALLHLWEAPEVRSAMGRAGVVAAASWSIETVCDRYVQLLPASAPEGRR